VSRFFLFLFFFFPSSPFIKPQADPLAFRKILQWREEEDDEDEYDDEVEKAKGNVEFVPSRETNGTGSRQSSYHGHGKSNSKDAIAPLSSASESLKGA